MQTNATKRSGTPAPACIGCQECNGLCRALLDLASVPEAVLHHAQTR